MADLCLGITAMISNIIAISSSWIHFTAQPPNAVTGCQSVTSVNLWFRGCKRLYCPNSFSYGCGYFAVDPVPQEWKVTQAMVALAFITSVIMVTAACSECGPHGRKALTAGWLLNMLWGIIATSVWTDYHSMQESTGVWFFFKEVFGGGYIFCIVGWIFSFFAAAATFYSREDEEPVKVAPLPSSPEVR
eukprot:gb/GEZN01014242.1/.p1 GENE.gb/GEZN01014242.1/~~gb/GEZN01014242.1/.p1  ORF type:complete len:189 (-),score=8.80 gb/GEZN01014242.1/:276-842(-)